MLAPLAGTVTNRLATTLPWLTNDHAGPQRGRRDAQPPSRCESASTDVVEALAADLAGSGLEQFDEAPFIGVGVALPWAAQDAAGDLALWPVVPDGRPACEPAGG